MLSSVQPDKEFHTWGEIAGYLDISPREAQYREKNDGLPVHRLPGKKSRVWARQSELDAWKARVSKVSNHPATVLPVVPPAPTLGRLSRRWLLAGVGAPLAVTAGVAALLKVRHPKSPTRAELKGNSLCAWDEMDNLLWKFVFPEPLDHGPNGMAGDNHRIVLVDFDGSGAKHVVAVSAVRQGKTEVDRTEAWCFSPRGKLLWRYRPDLKLTFGNTLFSGPWIIQDMISAPNLHGGEHIWFSINHEDWRPCALLRFGLEGTPSIQFVNCGNVFALHYVKTAAADYVLAGGVNNEYNKASLAILRLEAPPSRSPQTPGTRFECVNAPKGDPDRYFLFPPTEINAAHNAPYSEVRFITQTGNIWQMVTDEYGDDEGHVMYRFSADLEPLDLTFDETFGALHRRFEREDRINHDLAACPHLNAPTILDRWDPQHGWSKVAVPPNASVKPGALR
jgi:hypothetical protein